MSVECNPQKSSKQSGLFYRIQILIIYRYVILLILLSLDYIKIKCYVEIRLHGNARLYF